MYISFLTRLASKADSVLASSTEFDWSIFLKATLQTAALMSSQFDCL